MTVTEFLLLHTATQGANINYSHRVNVLFDAVGGVNADGTQLGKIQAITVTANCFSFNGLQDSTSVDLTTILQQVEEITFTFDGITYVLEIIEKTFFPETNAFYYFSVNCPTFVPNVFDGNVTSAFPNGGQPPYPEGQITFNFHPFLSDVVFATSDSNVLFNSDNVLRKSSDRFEADRVEGSIVPTNFSAILSTSASRAELQDSFYTDTGLTNARYNGSKNTTDNNSGVLPSLTARTFTGVIHPQEASNDTACGILRGNDDITEILLHSGETLLPTVPSQSAMIKLAEGSFSANEVAFNYTFVDDLDGEQAPNIDVGDILRPSGGAELMRVVAHNTFTKAIIVERRFLNELLSNPATNASISINTVFDKLPRTEILKIDSFDKDVNNIVSSKVFVPDGNYLIHTSPFGAVYSQSFCPPPLLIGIDDDTPGA